MELNEIEDICGPAPTNYEMVNPTSDNFVFQNDPNFTALNLYDFMGNGATVNSFAECAHYVTGGWEPFKTTIFDIGLIVLYSLIGLFSIYKIYKSGYYKYLNPITLFEKTKNYFRKFQSFDERENTIQKKEVLNIILSSFFFIQSYFLFDYIRTKSVRIPRFIDEYITLTSSVNFFKDLNFNAGEFIGGNYSVSLTSGPFSAVGSVIAWNLTEKLTIARISSFAWVYLLQIIFAFLIVKLYKSDFKFLFFISGLLLVLVPWWQGSLYSLGEFPSLIIFVNAIFLFPKLRSISLVLFSISIFYGKLLNLVPFAGFYIIIMIYEKKVRNIIKDLIFFLIPLSSWLLLANSKYEGGNAFIYIRDQFFFITNHQSSGTPTGEQNFFDGLTNSFISSEFSTWNSFDKIRLIIIPIIFLIIIFRNKEQINTFFGKITLPIISSLLFSYLWFWLLNTTKWMRHTQHFMVPLIIIIIYLVNFNIINSKLDLTILILLVGFFIENNKYLFILLAVAAIFIIYNIEENVKYAYIKTLLVVIVFIDISLPYFEKDTFGNLHHIIEDCRIELISSECKSSYLNEN